MFANCRARVLTIHQHPQLSFGMISLRLLAIVSLFCASDGASVFAQEWPGFRGPNGSGHATSLQLPARLTEQDIRWRIELPVVAIRRL
jgi:hypothetical protein